MRVRGISCLFETRGGKAVISCCCHHNIMTVYVLSDGSGPCSQVPSHLTRIPMALLCPNTNYNNKTVKGEVIHKGPLVRVATDDLILKTIIHEEDAMQNVDCQRMSINMIIFGALAESFSHRVNPGDILWVSGFTVGKSPTANKDKLHPCNLLLSGDDACIYVSKQRPPEPRSPLASRGSSLTPDVDLRTPRAPRYTYVRLDELKNMAVVNVYGVVVFFKQPFKSRGTDYCSSLKITDQSEHKIGCTIFCEKLEDHPRIFQTGDIIRMHRVKVHLYNSSLTLVNTFGFSVVTFSGTVGGGMEPRTSSKSLQLDEDDRRTIEELRAWAACQALLSSVSAAVPLSAVQPNAYFDLICQLLAKASIDSTCTLLRVWDGTRCPHALLKVIVEPNSTEGPSSFSKYKESHIANVLVYDNHVEVSRHLKPGAFLRIYNLRAIPGSSRVPGLTSSQPVELDHLAFHLHGGTSYGRGIRLLPENSPDVQELRRATEAFLDHQDEEVSELNDSELLEVWSTPPEFIEGDVLDCRTERCCDHQLQLVTLSQVKQSAGGQTHHVRAQIGSYEPRQLHRALKLFCCSCSAIQDVPDEELLAGIFSEATRRPAACAPPPWALSGQVDLPGDASASQQHSPSVHLSTKLMTEGKTEQLIFLMGCSLEETQHLAAAYPNVVPVAPFGGRLALLDLTAPFLFRGTNRHYGCKRCSEAAVREPSAAGVEQIDEKMIAETLGVQPLQLVLLMKLQLQDATDTLDVYLWRHAELFFSVAATDVSANQEAQNSIHRTMETLCPAEGSIGERPWLDLCLMAYQTEGEDRQIQTCYQICNTVVVKPCCNSPDNTQ
ncbi:protection of telomeres protein 1 isoform X1 [Poecilia latipinna]|uniref:Protection of telomeres protein 1 n=3 Tax=Poecilia TaxID=8080 RepID=A0A087YG74_POEFO|nr:PREDICTED: protection of telomeres protein 1 isoform X1 [Poecilia formosa]XP_014874658.1 PREDICTED: protection of telomeres protein 1 isoform X1 [Poecilia latipinna]